MKGHDEAFLRDAHIVDPYTSDGEVRVGLGDVIPHREIDLFGCWVVELSSGVLGLVFVKGCLFVVERERMCGCRKSESCRVENKNLCIYIRLTALLIYRQLARGGSKIRFMGVTDTTRRSPSSCYAIP